MQARHEAKQESTREQAQSQRKPRLRGCEDGGVRGGAKQANRRGILGGPGRR